VINRQPDCFERFPQRSDLVQFDEDAVGCVRLDAAPKSAGVSTRT
jgi:hypothetical protein